MAHTHQNRAEIISLRERDLEFEPQRSVASITHIIEQELNISHWMPKGGIILPKDGYEDLHIPTAVRHYTAHIGNRKEVIHVTAEIPDTILNRHPMVFGNGLLGSQRAYAKARNAVARNGTPAFTYDTPRSQAFLAELHHSHFLKPSKLLNQTLGAVIKLAVSLADEYGLEKQVVVIPHSMAGRSAVDVAEHFQERLGDDKQHPMHSILFNEAAGLQEQGLLRMSRRVMKFLKEVPGADASTLAGSLEYLCRNPVKTAVETLSIGKDNPGITDKVRNLGNFGIRTAILVGAADSLISAEDTARKSGVGVADLFALYANRDADHLYFQKFPLEAAMAQLQAYSLLHNVSVHPSIKA